MANEIAARRYATAIFELAGEANAIESTRADLHAVRDAVYHDPAAARFFLSPVVGRAEKARLLGGVLANRVSTQVMNGVLLLVRKRREALLDEIVKQYDALEISARGAERLAITSARELSKQDLATIVARLEALYGKRFDVTQRVDPTLLGGLRVMLGDRRIDGSVAGKLEQLARTIFANTPRSEHPST